MRKIAVVLTLSALWGILIHAWIRRDEEPPARGRSAALRKAATGIRKEPAPAWKGEARVDVAAKDGPIQFGSEEAPRAIHVLPVPPPPEDLRGLPGRGDGPSPASTPSGIAELLGMSADRARTFSEAAERARDGLRALEARFAAVSREGEETRIRIPSLGEEGAFLRSEWEHAKSAYLTPDEKARYDKFSLEDALFPAGKGEGTREITLKRGGNGVEYSDSRTLPEGLTLRSAGGAPAEWVLPQYRHLLGGEGR